MKFMLQAWCLERTFNAEVTANMTPVKRASSTAGGVMPHFVRQQLTEEVFLQAALLHDAWQAIDEAAESPHGMPDYVRQQLAEEADILQRAWQEEDAAQAAATDMPDYGQQELLEKVGLLDQAWQQVASIPVNLAEPAAGTSSSNDSRGTWSPHALQAAAASSARARPQRDLKWGRCSSCGVGMSPWLYSSGPKKGRLYLLCNNFQSGDASGKRVCFKDKPFPMTRLEEAPKWRAFQSTWQSLLQGRPPVMIAVAPGLLTHSRQPQQVVLGPVLREI